MKWVCLGKTTWGLKKIHHSQESPRIQKSRHIIMSIPKAFLQNTCSEESVITIPALLGHHGRVTSQRLPQQCNPANRKGFPHTSKRHSSGDDGRQFKLYSALVTAQLWLVPRTSHLLSAVNPSFSFSHPCHPKRQIHHFANGIAHHSTL